MAITVETGAIVPDADAFIPASFADAYFASRGGSAWLALSLSVKEQAIVQATDYIQIRWGSRLTGSLVSPDQPLLFPRRYFYAGDGIMPLALQQATAEYALRASQGSLAPDFTLDNTGRLPIKTVQEVGPIRDEVTYATNGYGGVATPNAFRPYPIPDGIMASLVNSSSGQVIR